MQKIDEQLKQSVAEYKAILSILQEISSTTAQQRPDEIIEKCNSLHVLQHNAQMTDKAIADSLYGQAEIDAVTESLLKNRHQLLKSVQSLNRAVFSQLKGIMALFSDELNQLKGNLTAMNGYKKNQNASGNLINANL